MKTLVLSVSFMLVLTGSLLAQEHILSVHCVCDPPTVMRPPGFPCATLCAPPSATAKPSAPPRANIQQQVMTNMFGSFMQGFVQGMQPRQEDIAATQALMEQQQAEAARQRVEAARKAQEEEERHQGLMSELKGVSGEIELTMKTVAPPPPPSAEPSILAEAQELLRRCIAADEAATRTLSDERTGNSP